MKKSVKQNISQMDGTIEHLSSIKKKISPHKTPTNTTQDTSPPLNIFGGSLV